MNRTPGAPHHFKPDRSGNRLCTQCGCISSGAGYWTKENGVQQDLPSCVDPKDVRIEKLETALRELVGFAERNAKRAEAAWRDSQRALGAAHPHTIAGERLREDLLKNEARLHDANRFHLVVRDRVAEALAP